MTVLNHCGTCTACCRVYAIPEYDKPAGKWCQHCTIGKGCNIYEARPERCVGFECLWLQSQSRAGPAALGPELRPDRCKVVFAPSTNERIMTAITMPNAPDAWQRKPVRALIDRLNRSGLAVAVGPPAATVQQVFKPDGTVEMIPMTEPDADGMQWSKRSVYAKRAT